MFRLKKIIFTKVNPTIFRRWYIPVVTGTENCSEPVSRGLVLGVYADENNKKDTGLLTPAAKQFNENNTNGRLLELLRISGYMPKRGQARIFYQLDKNFTAVAVCGLGSECLGYDRYEMMDEGKEAIRMATAAGCKALAKIGTAKIWVENMGHAESAAEGAAMSIWKNQEFKTNKEYVPQLDMFVDRGLDCDWDGWNIGMQKAQAQNLARQLQETPSNHMTPTLFAQNVVQVLCQSGVNVDVKVRGWVESQGMDAFLALAKGSCEPPIFLELSYYGTSHSERPIVLIGQGVTYDSGGLCVRSKKDLLHQKGAMSGAACVVAACRAIAALKLPVNVRGMIPLCENMIGCNSMKPGDVLTATNEKSIEVQRVDNGSVLALIDALLYAQTFGPKYIVDITTLSPKMLEAVGPTASGIFTNSEELWQQMKAAAIHTGDRVWRMPLWEFYSEQVTNSECVDVQNVGRDSGGEPCKNAAVLREFVACGKWLHMEAFNVAMTNGQDFRYLNKGMSGRPTRTLIEFVAQTVCKEKHEAKERKTEWAS